MENKTRDFMQSSYGDNKADKEKELNESMTIKPNTADEYTTKIMNIGGTSNA